MNMQILQKKYKFTEIITMKAIQLDANNNQKIN